MDAFINAKESETTQSLEWEKKVITREEITQSNLHTHQIIVRERDWLSGGKNREWKWYRVPYTGDLVLERR